MLLLYDLISVMATIFSYVKDVFFKFKLSRCIFSHIQHLIFPLNGPLRVKKFQFHRHFILHNNTAMASNLVAFLCIIRIKIHLKNSFRLFLDRIKAFEISLYCKISTSSTLLSKPGNVCVSQIPSVFFFFFFFFIWHFFFFLFVVDFVIHWNETAKGLHVCLYCWRLFVQPSHS